ncbi:nitroreductase family protein [Acetivibrio saccincola]|jgi:nitroreductase|uniref:NAD(P)H nitroreductase n=1 Tax=Acetivibrio saccincola TaxID=1677857 RepID=A0A2K9E0M2_9FIRM|nr:nitroreductase family protein [Acetivibrio saccincola]AUG57327.1 nitroreductase A [Acetivibrio saccincola]NLW26203.1 NAD(P)H nitroreductase [Acetivibrio saccincola]PQQ67263.1 NAD(P)H nitroreductase [Acetivibrio saccincola]HOA96322.1 nitroreductase family protein [Acetivibrio saccincola]HQD29182.1 nitroreductase family protein [Acetivibrio saccincola]
MFFDLLKERRSIRKYQDRVVEKEKVDIILKSALLSPSSRSRRPWEFVVVTDREVLKKLSMCREHSSAFLEGAPLGIVVISDPSICDVWVEDCSIASIIIQLSAHSLGLGSCWIQVRDRYHKEGVKAEDYIKNILNIPDKYAVECIIAIGYPDEKKEGYDLNKLPFEKIHFGSYNYS